MSRLAAIAVATLLLVDSPAGAAERYDIGTMTCQQVTAALARQSPAILRYQSKTVPGLSVYNTYYGKSATCPAGQFPQRRTVQARDGSCAVYQCVRRSHPSGQR